MSRKQRPLAALVMVALISAGCSNAAATASDPGSNGGNNTAATHTKAMKFSACMRDNGVKEFPDPDASGELTIEDVVNGSSLDTNTAAFKQAISACKDLQPAGFMGRKRSAKEQKGALKFAQCMRDNGVADFPDPSPGAPLIDTNRIPSTEGSGGMDVLHAAMQTCRDLSAASGVKVP